MTLDFSTDLKIQNAFKELAALESNKSRDENDFCEDAIQIIKLPMPRARKMKELNSKARSNRTLDTIRFYIDGLSSPLLLQESILELLNISESNNGESLLTFLNEIFSKIDPNFPLSEENVKNLLLMLANCLNSILNVESIVPEELVVRLLSRITVYDSLVVYESRAYREIFKEFEKVRLLDLVIWIISKYILVYEINFNLSLPDSRILHELKGLLSKIDLLSLSIGSLKVTCSLLEYWVTQDVKASIDFLIKTIKLEDLKHEAVRKLLITASGFIYGAKELFNSQLIPPPDYDDELSLAILVNYVDRFTENRSHFRRSHYLTRLNGISDHNKISYKLCLFLGFLYEFDAPRALPPLYTRID